MGVEIERKFLVRDKSVVANLVGTAMRQGYLSVDPERTVRVRVAGLRAFVTIKGAGSESGASRAEYEYGIPAPDAEELLDRLALRPLIEKTRYRLPAGDLVWEIDVFRGDRGGAARMDRHRGHRRSALLQRQPREPPVPGLGRAARRIDGRPPGRGLPAR